MLLTAIESQLPNLAAAEARVGRAVLANPQGTLDGNIRALAQAAQSSEPTVVRFCRSVGCEGWHDFKLKLGQTLALQLMPDLAPLTDGDGTQALCQKICNRSINVLMSLRATLDSEAVERALNVLAAAKRIDVYGHGSSGVVAQDCAHKLFRTGVPCVAYVDPYVHAISAALLTPEAAVVVFSQRGHNASLLKTVAMASRNGARVIAVAPSGSAVIQKADVALTIDLPRDEDTYTPISARLAHLTLIDILAVGLAMRRGQAFRDRVREAQAELKSMDVEFEGYVARDRRPVTSAK
jgi:RpiR family transcriptional regulator, carbohydrate utilization regulator